MMKVDFMLIGAAKCGTTSLAYELAQHPQINFSKIKEPHFFSKTENWKERLSEYHHLFQEEQGKIYGEASPYYTLYPEYPDTAGRIFEYNPDVKLIYCIRNPVERIYSNYKFQHAFNQLKYPLNAMEKEILENPIYINRSKYYMQLHQYLRYFSKDQLHICLFEDYITNNMAVLNQIYSFLSVDRLPPDSFADHRVHINQTKHIKNLTRTGNFIGRLPIIYQLPKGIKHLFRPFFTIPMNRFKPMTPEFEQRLWDMLLEDVHKMSELTGRDLVEIWGKKNG